MVNIERLEKYIRQLEKLVEDTERRMVAGAEWLDAQLGSLKLQLGDLRAQLAEATEPEKGDEDFVRLRPSRNSAVSIHHEVLENPGVFDRLLK